MKIVIYKQKDNRPSDTHAVRLGIYWCGYTELCDSCKLRFICLTQYDYDCEVSIDYAIIMNGMEWEFALEQYLHGRILKFEEVAKINERIHGRGWESRNALTWQSGQKLLGEYR